MEAKRFHYNPEEAFSDIKGGWTKEVKGINTDTNDGFSIKGDFMARGKRDWYYTGRLYLNCSLYGKGAYGKKEYVLFMLNDTGEIVQVQKILHTKDWASDLWPSIESFLMTKDNETRLPLSEFSDEELLLEVKRRGLIK